jgi:aspartate carbamoyltransferase catalytic subunit
MRDHSQDMEQRRLLMGLHAGRVVTALFYEPSTRTRLSFVSAAKRLGMHVIETENAAEFSSASKGETIEDSTRVVAGYSDLIVMRHKENGAANRAAAVSHVPVINAGDGTGEHPTQALLDLYTIENKKKTLSGLHVVVGGDLKHGRTARSLTQLMTLYPGNHFSFVSTDDLKMGDDVKGYVLDSGSTFSETTDMYEPLPTADVVYWTRMQTERHNGIEQRGLDYVIGERALSVMHQDAIIMHPLPRVGEIDPAIDNDERAIYFDQAQNGLYVRMALLDMLMPEDGLAA